MTCAGKSVLLSFKTYRSSHRRCSLRKDVLRNFAKFTGKHLLRNFAKFTGKHLGNFAKFTGKHLLRNFAKFTGKNLCQSLFFNNVADLDQSTQNLFQFPKYHKENIWSFLYIVFYFRKIVWVF